MLETTTERQQVQPQEQHILVIDDHECGIFALDAATYSVGRDSSNAIVLNDESVSRQHALLLRMPVPGSDRYQYRLIDGNAQGKPSNNGTLVNGKPCKTHELVKGDEIQFGKESFCTYMTIAGAEMELSQYLESAEFQSIKAGMTNPKETMNAILGLEDLLEQDVEDLIPSSPEQSIVNTPTTEPSSQPIEEKQLPQHGPFSQHWKMILGVGIVGMTVVLGIWQTIKPQPYEIPSPQESSLTRPDQSVTN